MQRIKTLSEYFKKYELSEKDPESFWSEIAGSFTWKKNWNKELDWVLKKQIIKNLNTRIKNTKNIKKR